MNRSRQQFASCIASNSRRQKAPAFYRWAAGLSRAFILQSRFEQGQQLLLLPETRNLFLANSPPTLSLNNIAYNLSPLFPYVFN
jgi:hypothetical protein